MISIETQSGTIVEPFDQKDGQDLGEHFRRSNSPHRHQLRKQKVTNELREATRKRNLEIRNQENTFKARFAAGAGSVPPS
jgi:hypothetical protein